MINQEKTSVQEQVYFEGFTILIFQTFLPIGRESPSPPLSFHAELAVRPLVSSISVGLRNSDFGHTSSAVALSIMALETSLNED